MDFDSLSFKNYVNYKLDKTTKDLLIDLCNDGTKESHFSDSYSDFWVRMLQDSEYKPLGTIAVNKLVMMPTNYLAEKRFSAPVYIKNRLKIVDELMRGAFEDQTLPQIEKIAEKIDVS